MVSLSKYWSSERSRLFASACLAFTAIALSYEYAAATERVDSFMTIIGGGVLLTLLVVVPSLLVENEQESH
jgi:hypothetical protein